MEASVKQKLANPRNGANAISIATFGYTFGLFLKGYKKDLGEDDITEVLAHHRSDKLGDMLENAWEKEKSRAGGPSLWRAFARVFGLELFARGFGVLFSESVLKLLQPLALSQLIVYYTQTGNTRTNINQAYLYSGLIVALSLCNVVLVHHNVGNIQLLAMKARIACCSLIYRKSLKLSKSALLDTTAGQLTNLLSNDIHKFDAGFMFNTFWVCPIQLVVSACLLYTVLGFTSTIGVFCLALCAPIQLYLGKISSKLRLKIALKTDQRLRLMNEIISGIQIIKMYTWEKPFSNLVAAIRKDEVDYISSKSYVRGTLLSFLYFSKIAIFLSILTYILTGNVLNAEYVFVTASFYSNIRQSVNMQFPRVISDFADVRVSIRRLQKFLLMNEIDSEVVPDLITCQNPVGKEESQVEFRNASASWREGTSEETFHNVSFKVTDSQLVAIIGPVGSGKSSILHAILKELPLSGGTLKVVGKIAYASQEPWLFGASIQQNILFGQVLDTQRYAEVIRVCALEQDLAFFPYGDRSLVGERGITLSGGQKARISLARAVYADADIYLLDDPLSAVDPHVGRQLFDDCITGYLRNKCRILVTHQTQFVQTADRIILVENGKIIVSGTYEEIKESNVSFAKYVQINDPEQEKQSTDIVIVSENKAEGVPAEMKEQKSSGSVSGNIYLKYFAASGNVLQRIAVVLLFVIATISVSSTDYFLTYWVNQEQIKAEKNITDNEQLPTSTYIYIYSCMIVALILFGFASIFFFISCCMRSSIALHNEMFLSIVHAPLRFFNVNPSGRILNRFSKDIGSVDELLPFVAVECINVTLATVSVILLICIVNPWLLIATAVIFFIFYCIRLVYMSTSRNVKRLEGITRSPVFIHINASLLGLTTIRAFGMQSLLQNEFDSHQDVHTSVWYWFLSCTRAFGFYLDLFSVLYIAIVTFSFFLSPTEYGGNVGLAITQAINLTGMLQWGTRQWSEIQNYMTSVERVVEYTKIEPEDNRKKQQLPTSWPENGKISFVSLSLRYSEHDPYVLKKLTFSIEAKEKIGVVGRTGAGKSSLITALFQLANTEGSILIDEVDITQVPFDSFRNKISIIPQEPVLFSGTLRKNLDPFNSYTDGELWNALDDVELKALVSELPLGLLCSVADGGSNFSVGQRQLLCLARAIIRKNKILIMDEATANVDPQTDTIIQATIRNNFSDCTVITIAHRLNTVIDSDKILVLDAGTIIEFDTPHRLLENEVGMFYSMVQRTGQGSAEALVEIAEMSYSRAITKRDMKNKDL